MNEDNSVQACSPVPQVSPTKPMALIPAKIQDAMTNFFFALADVSRGNKATKYEWRNPDIYIFMRDERLKIHFADGRVCDLILSTGDMIGEDWIVIDEGSPSPIFDQEE